MIDIFVCGDVVNLFSEKQFVDPDLCEFIKKADYSICNFEGSIHPGSLPVSKWVIAQHSSTMNSLKMAVFNILLLGNNHIADYGKEGLISTINEVKKYSLDYVGAGFSTE